MKVIQIFIFFILFFGHTNVDGQAIFTTANGHSHNDYNQANPFSQAYNAGFGSIEADIFLMDGKLLVGHDSADLTVVRKLETMYLDPLAEHINNNSGHPYPDSTQKLQLLIDVKTDSINTLDALVKLLDKYPAIIHNSKVQVVITGNRPAESLYTNYPGYIWFDGRLGQTYNSAALSKIALLSEDLAVFSKWKDKALLPENDKAILSNLISNAHAVNKPVRFWASPDYPVAWEELAKLNVDYINTDHIEALANFMRRKNDSLHLMSFNRFIRSAGTVIRFGDPQLENHAMDAAILPGNMVVTEDRYGITAINPVTKKVITQWTFPETKDFENYMSTYSGIKTFSDNGKTMIAWGAADRGGKAAIMLVEWNNGFVNPEFIPIEKKAPASNAIPNELVVTSENGASFIYVVLNGNNELLKIRLKDKSIIWTAATGVAPYGLAKAGNNLYVTNWAGSSATDSTKERAGVPWGLAYTDPRTGATATGSVGVFNASTGQWKTDIATGLHPNAIIADANGKCLYVSNGSSDAITVISTKKNKVIETINVGLLQSKFSLQGSTPIALALSADESRLYVTNGFDNAVAVVQLGKKSSSTRKGNSTVVGYIPTEAYPGGIKLVNDQLVVTNLEAQGANVIDAKKQARSIHNQLSSVSIIPVPDKQALVKYTEEVTQLSLMNRMEQFTLPARKDALPVPVPERLGEPSVFKHVIYIIKENKTYDQVFGDIPTGEGDSSLCVFGKNITPNMHALAEKFGWMDDYYASGKSSAEGHQWTDAGMVSDYVERSVRAWFRSYPHRQEDALVYNKSGFIWNQAMDNGKSVRIFGEACRTYYDTKLKWADLYNQYTSGKQPDWKNGSTIARIRPIISETYPDCDNINFSDQQRADVFLQAWEKYEQGDSLPNLLILSLPNDHTAGTSPNFPTPNAMVADNDLAVGRIVERISKSKYWDSTVIFITQDDSQSGWDHISAYRTVGLTVSPYSSGKLVSTNYNQTSMLRTIEQILGLPPMNVLDATAKLMTDCFQKTPNNFSYTALPNNIPLDDMNGALHTLKGKARKYALESQEEVFNEVDGGEDDAMNRIIWFYAKGNAKYPEVK
ncbi:hypothetical protein BH11BAC3_BH11BAC3_27260 [soil metagenome]